MSYILDAVRKAEEERRQSQSAGTRSLAAQSMPQKSNGKKKYWFLGIALVLIANSAIWYLVSGNGPDTAAKQQAAQSAQRSQSEAADNAKASKASGEASVRQIASAQGVEPVQSGGQSSIPITARTATQQVKLWQASASAQTAINALEFSFHVYSTDSNRRTIIINNQRMREGDRISDSLSLERITEIGVLLGFEDLLVEVEILEQW